MEPWWRRDNEGELELEWSWNNVDEESQLKKDNVEEEEEPQWRMDNVEEVC